jgi:diadenosine tetraphosphate (Ap4A) HIT family hydrolase
MLMMVDFHVHYHVIPRYKEDILYLGKIWRDNDYPKLPTITGTPNDEKVLSELSLSIKNDIVSNNIN